MRAAQNRPVRRRAATNAAQAETGAQSSSVRLNVTIGPNAAVSGARTTATAGAVVVQARLQPAGAPIWREYSGFSPCVRA
jgi:hypothetical protein